MSLIPKGISKNVISLGWVSFFTDLASEMLYPIFPLFLVGTLGADPSLLGLIEGIAEGISAGLRWLGGALSDRFRRRKPFVFAGYSISAISKPIIGLAAYGIGWPLYLVGRALDRFGKSIRTSARDALITDSTEPEHRGVAFGFHRMMDTCGAIAGPLASLLILSLMVGSFSTIWNAQWPHSGHEHETAGIFSGIPLQNLFFIALVPGLCSAGLILAGVKEILPKKAGSGGPPPIFQKFPAPFWRLIAANFLFSLGNSSDTFLILRSSELGLTLGGVVLAYAMYNFVYAAASTPLGSLSDRIGRKPVVAAGWIVYAIVYIGFSVLGSAWGAWVLLGVYGLYNAMTEGVTKAMVSDLVPPEQRAGAIGMYYTASGFAVLLGSILAGALWNYRLFDGAVMPTFAIGAAFSLLAVPVIMSVPTENK